MKVTEVKWPAVRAFRKVWTPLFEGMIEAEEADAAFDAGEWSGEAHSNLQDERYNEILAKIAPRFELSTKDLNEMVYIHFMHNSDCFMRGVQNDK